MLLDRWAYALVVTCSLLSAVTACDRSSNRLDTNDARAGTLVAQLGSGLPVARSTEARTSVATVYTGCRTPDSLPQPVRCTDPRPPDSGTLQASARAAERVRNSMDADAIHATALIDLHFGAARGNSLPRSLQSLRQAARYSQSATAWANLAAAELVRADRDNEPRARVSALDAAVRAVSADSTNPIARFNLALAAERLGLDGRAREEWMRYQTLDPAGQWNAEARARVTAMDRRAVPSASGVLSSARIDSLAMRDPSALRLRVLTDELGAWSSAVLMRQPARADSALNVIRTAGEALATRYGDRTLLDVVREVSLQAPPARVAESAAAFAAGQRANGEGRYAAAESLFVRASARGAAPTLAAWSRTYAAVQRIYTGNTALAMLGLSEAIIQARAARRPALEARAGWSYGVMLFRAGRQAEGAVIVERVSELSRQLGDRESAAAVAGLLGEDRYVAGDERTAARYALEAMSTLRAHRSSLRLRNALNLIAWAADDRGLSGAAAVIRGEDAAVALASGHPEFHVEALIAAARSRLLQGDTVRALATLSDVERAAVALPPSAVTRWLAANAAQLRAMAGVRVRASQLDSAVAFFGEQRNGVLLVDALLTRAHALTTIDAARAERDLDSALVLMQGRAAQYRSSAERRALERRIRNIAARSALAYLARSDPHRALAAIERGRMGNVPPAAARSGTLVLDFLLVGDTLVTWRIGADPIAVTRQIVSARAIALARDRLVQSAEAGAMDRGALMFLYDVLLRRQGASLRGVDQLVIVADDELAGVPFAALYDSAGRGEHVVERVSVRVVPRLADGLGDLPVKPITRAMFVSDPAFDRSVFPGLPALAGARTEVEAGRRFYDSPVILSGAAATTSAVRTAMLGADLVHFASHARFDPERPEQSRLVLAPDGDEREGLTARAISGMRLSGVRLAVLSSCESTRSGVADAPLTIGLAKAFHDAGVPAVVGALWRVDDGATAALMTEFHRQYSGTRDAARALRGAQLTLLRDTSETRRDPSAWGAFVFTGR